MHDPFFFFLAGPQLLVRSLTEDDQSDHEITSKVMVLGMTNRRCAWTRDRSSKDRGGSVGTITAVSWLQSKCACCFFSFFHPPSFFSPSIRVIRECWAQCRWSPSQNNSEKEKLFIMGTHRLPAPTPIACTNPQPRTVEMPVGPFHISSYL